MLDCFLGLFCWRASVSTVSNVTDQATLPQQMATCNEISGIAECVLNASPSFFVPVYSRDMARWVMDESNQKNHILHKITGQINNQKKKIRNKSCQNRHSLHNFCSFPVKIHTFVKNVHAIIFALNVILHRSLLIAVHLDHLEVILPV